MTGSSRQPNDWNTFQRLNRGRWNRDELKRQWHLQKQRHNRHDGQEPAAEDATVAASHNSSRVRQMSTLKEGLKALVVSSSTKAKRVKAEDSSDAVCSTAGTADQAASSPTAAVAAVYDALLTCNSQNSSSAVYSQFESCNGTPTSSAHQQQSPVQQPPVQLQECAGPPSPRHPAAVDASPPAAAADAVAGRCNADVSPCINPDLAQAPTTAASAQELAKLREAVYHLLSKQAGLQPPQFQPDEASSVVDRQQLSSSLPQQDHRHYNQQHLQQQQRGLQHGVISQGLSLLPAPTGVAGQPLAVTSGCFGLSWSSHSQLSWNTFQKSCKGRGLSRSEISAAYQQAKQHYLETGQLLDLDLLLLQQQQQEQGHACGAGASCPQQQQQQQHHGRWSSVQHWVRSRTASRTASRSCSTAVSPGSSPARPNQLSNSQHTSRVQTVNEGQRQLRRSGMQQWLHSRAAGRAASRDCSAAVSPNTSPTVWCTRQRGQHPYAGDQLGSTAAGAAGEGNKWGAFKEWLHSRGSSRANSRLGTPAASPGQKYLTACAEEQQQQQRRATDKNTGTPPQQQQQQMQRWQVREREGEDSDADADASYLPFAQQLQGHLDQLREQQQAGSSGADPQTSDHSGSCGSNSSGSSKTEQVQQEPIGGTVSRIGSHMPIVAAAIAALTAAETAAAAVSPLTKQPAASQPSAAAAAVAVITSASAAQTAVSATAAPLTAAGAVRVLRIGHRLVRESVCDDLAGVLEGFSPWLPVEPQHIRKLKKAVPQQPGLYEWGVRLPCNRALESATLRSSDSSSSSVTAGSASGRAQRYGRVLPFYLGKAGTLKPQRPRRSVSQYGPVGYTGETLRSRLSNYVYARSGRLGPTNEPHKLAFFQRQLQAGGKLYLRWRVHSSIEPLEAETYLLNRLDYAANYMNNRGRRPLIAQ